MDQFGDLTYPEVAIPIAATEAVTDPALSKIGAYLAAVLNSELNAAWGAVAPNTPVVRTVSTDNPSDSTFNSRDLPGLFIWRMSAVDDQLADDYLETMTDVVAFWVPQSAEQSRRSLRDPIFNGFQKSVSRALNEGRNPAWIDPTDDDPTAPAEGSVLVTRCALFRDVYVTSCRREVVTIQTDDDQRARYPAISVTIRISEVSFRDPAARGSASANTTTMTAGALVLESQQPPES